MENIGIALAIAGWTWFATYGWTRRGRKISFDEYADLAIRPDGSKELVALGEAALRAAFPEPLKMWQYKQLMDPGDGLVAPLPDCYEAGILVDSIAAGGCYQIEDLSGLRDRSLANAFRSERHRYGDTALLRAMAREVLARKYFAGDEQYLQPWARGVADEARKALGL